MATSTNTAMYDIGIRCKYLLTMSGAESQSNSQSFGNAGENHFIGITGKKIAEISKWTLEKKALCREFIDADSHVAMPGLVNGHTHLAMTLFRGLGDDLPFHRWLFDLILPLESALVDSEFVRIGTELAALECIRFGVTTVSDMYFFAETIADVCDRAGLRGWIGQVSASNPLPEDKVLGTNKTQLFERLYEKYRDHERIVPALAPHAPYTCNDELLKEVVRLSEKYNSPIHTHVSETAREVEESLKVHGKTPVQRLNELGILASLKSGRTSRTLAAHCVHLNDADIEIMKRTNTAIVHNPDSNLKLSSGIAPLAKYLRAGIPVALGTDGSASKNDLSIFGVMDLATKLQKVVAPASVDGTGIVAEDSLKCATLGGAQALGIEKKTGSLEVGKEADVILVDLNYPHLQPVYDVRSTLVYATQGLEVDTVICQGRMLMRKKTMLTLDQEKILSSVRGLSEKVRSAAYKLVCKV